MSNDYRACLFGPNGVGIIVVTLLLWTGIGFPAYAAPADLDPSFGNGGRVLSNFGGGRDKGRALAIQADGKIVVAGSRSNGTNDDFALVRYNTDGSLDTSFGFGGMVMTQIYNSDEVVTALAIQPDGKIIAAGYYNYYSISDAFALTRYNPDGTLDATFGTGGKVMTHIGSYTDHINAVALQSDGRIVVAGSSQSYSGNVSRVDFALARYNSNGNLDTSFGVGGKVVSTDGRAYYAVAIQIDGKIIAAGSDDLNILIERFNANGTLDTSFNSTGKISVKVGTGYNYANGVAVQSDGKIVAAGYTSCNTCSSKDFALARFNANGTLDASFNAAGTVTTSIGTNDIARSVLVQTDGKIVAAGYSDSKFAVVRYTSAGALDVTFGTGGKVASTVGTSIGLGAFAAALQADGRIVVAGERYDGSSYDFEVVRYNTDGSLDNGFNGTGTVTTDVGTKGGAAYGVAIQPDGKIVAAGSSPNPTSTDDNFALARYNADGTPDTGFGNRGIVNINSSGTNWDDAWAVALQPDGKIVAAGRTNVTSSTWAFFLARYSSDGTLDTGFGTGGKVMTSIGGSNDGANAIALQPDGKIVAAGSSYNTTSKNTDIALVRYLPGGTLDTAFGSGGKVVTPIGSLDDGANAIALQPDGKIVVAGYSASSVSKTDFALLRYSADGTLDANFGTGGKVTTAIGSGKDGANAMALQPDGKIVVAGDSHNGTNTDFALVRYNPDGSLDTSFGNGGKLTTAIESGNDTATAVALQKDGKIVAAGSNDAWHGATRTAMAVVRYLPNGSLDTSFGTGGILGVVNDANAMFNQSDNAYAVAIQDDGRIVIGGVLGAQFGVIRLQGKPALALDLSTTALDFGPQNIGASSASQSVTIANGGSTTLTIDSVLTAPAGEFPIAGNTCGTTLAPAANCQVSLTFAPQGVGTRSGSLSLASNVTGSPHTVSLSGTGVGTTTIPATTTTSTMTTQAPTTTTVASTTTTTQAAAAVHSFVSGWNLLGNGADAQIDVASTFFDTNTFTTVWKWIAAQSAWAFHAPSLAAQGGTVLADYAASKGYQLLTSIAGGEGFWVNAKQTGSVSVLSGNAIGVTALAPKLTAGWNLVSIGETATAKQFCDAQSGGVTTLWAWDATNSAWYFYAPSLDASGALAGYISGKAYLDFITTNKTLGPGVGFWVNRP